MEYSSKKGEYDPLSGVDHESVCADFLITLNGSTGKYVGDEYSRQLELGQKVFLTFQDIAKYMRGFDGDGKYTSDFTSVAVFKSGNVLALSLLERLAASLEITTDEFYSVWEQSGIAMVPDVNQDRYSDSEPQEKLQALVEGIHYIGESYRRSLPEAYGNFLDRCQEGYVEIEDHLEQFQTGFWYVFGQGYGALQYAYERQRVGVVDFESALVNLTETAQPTGHATLAKKFIDLMNESREGASEVLGLAIRDNIEADEPIVEVLNALSLAIYPNELGNFALDDTGEAFFAGANLGMHIGFDLGDSQLKVNSYLNQWKHVRVHKQLGGNGPDYSPHIRTDAKHALDRAFAYGEIPQEYSDLLELIDEQQGYEDEESVAFRSGFRYALNTMLLQIDAQKKGEAKQAANKELKHFDDEMETFLRENDLTGSLQDVFAAYLDHCATLEVDPDDLTDAEAATMLELTLQDYDKLMPELSEISIHGPCFVQLANDGDKKRSSAVILEKGGKITGTIRGFRIAIAPKDMTYTQKDLLEIGQFPLRYMPSFVLTQSNAVLSSGKRIEEESDIIIGFAVPGARYSLPDF